MTNKKNCWSCGYLQNEGHDTFLGLCTYFSTKGHPNRDIPPNVADVGCPYFVAKTDKKKTPDAESAGPVAVPTKAAMKESAPTHRYEYQERAAIMEYDGQLSREKAEARAAGL